MTLKNDLTTGPLPNIVGMDVPDVVHILGGDLHFFKRLLSQFVENVPEAMQRIKHFIQVGQHEAAASLLHKLRGDAGNLRATVVFDVASKLESSLHNPGPEIDALLESLHAALNYLLESSREWLTSIPENDTLQHSNRQLTESESLIVKTKVQELSTLLELGSVRSRRMSQEISEVLEGTVLADAFVPIRNYIADFQFMNALVELKKTFS